MRVILADDSVLLREGIARLLVEAGFVVAGQAGDGDELERLVDRSEADAAVVDIRMPPTHTDEGIRAAHRIREKHPSIGILVLSQYLETAYAMTLLGGDARGLGYVLKDRMTDIASLTDAIRRVSRGESVVDPEIVSRLVGRRREHDPFAEMSSREREVMGLMAEGRSNQAIAERLYMSIKTVEAHVRSIFVKLGLEQTPDDHRRVLAVLRYLQSLT